MIFNENGVIINSPNFWVENVNRDIKELNSIIESIQIDYLHEGFNLKEAASKFAAKVKKIFEWIKQKIGEIKNWLKSKFDPLINKIKTNKNKIVDNFKKLSKEQKEKLFKKNNSVNESYYLTESGVFDTHPKTTIETLENSANCLPKKLYSSADNKNIEEIRKIYNDSLYSLKSSLIASDSGDDDDFNVCLTNHFNTKYKDFVNGDDIQEVIDIATTGSYWINQLEKDINAYEQFFNNYITAIEKLGDVEEYITCNVNYLKSALSIVSGYATHAISYTKKITLLSGQVCAQLLKQKLNEDD